MLSCVGTKTLHETLGFFGQLSSGCGGASPSVPAGVKSGPVSGGASLRPAGPSAAELAYPT